MSREFILVDPEQFDRLEEVLDDLASLLSEIRGSTGTINMPGQPSLFEREEKQTEPKYEIGRTSTHSYADVADREIDTHEFSLQDAWRKIEPLIKTKAKRPRDSLRQSLDNDRRFERIEDRSGTWFRRRDVDGAATAQKRREAGQQGFQPETLDHTDEADLPKGYRLKNPSAGWYRPIGPDGEPLTDKNKRKNVAIEICVEDARKRRGG